MDFKTYLLYDALETMKLRVIHLERELKEERSRHDRLQDFEVAEAEELRKCREENKQLRKTLETACGMFAEYLKLKED